VNFKDRVALVTGGNKGFGRAIPVALGRERAHVLLNFQSDFTTATQSKNEIEKIGGKATLMKANLSQKEEINCLFDSVKAEIGELHVLVNNAGISLWRKNGDFGKLEPGQLLKMNLIAPFLCMQRAFPLINSSGGGVIINISSLRAAVSYKGAGIYAATKSALATLTKIEPLEFGPR